MTRSLKPRRGAFRPNERIFLCLLVSSVVFTAWCILSLKPARFRTVQPLVQRHALRHTNLETASKDGREFLNAIAISPQSPFTDFYHEALPVGPHSLTVVLPVTHKSLPDLEALLSPFFTPSTALREVVIACPESLILEARNILRTVLSKSQGRDYADISLHPSVGVDSQDTGVIRAASQATTDWILFLDEGGLTQVDSRTRDRLLSPRVVPFPIGPRGMILSPITQALSCVIPTEFSQVASYLLPPFVTPSSLVLDNNVELVRSDVWASLGRRSYHSRPEKLGGIVMEQSESAWCPEATPHTGDLHQGSIRPNVPGLFALLLPVSQDLHLFAPAACKLQETGHKLDVLLFREISDSEVLRVDFPADSETQFITSGRCRLHYDVLSLENMRHMDEFVSQWLSSLDDWPDVVLTLTDRNSLAASPRLERGIFNTTLIRIPRADLPYTSWMGTLSMEEWRNWNAPHIDVSVITNDRPWSLARLLSSLAKGRYFGDALNLRINLEQSSDTETLRIVGDFEWDHGSVYLHHRVVRGGLLPAVVESWYPHSNHTYGLLLEDDVELSPLYYAWVKMSVLRYRYGEKSNQSPQLFGISLYQQKNIELKPEGRQPFNARALFSNNGLSHPSTPYLSQIPCSWGAVYFPEHWREFHDYLSARLPLKFNEHIVLDVRSNKWSKSWKKYFIELVYLRGYVMLYPNYEDFISLSTNHLEIGSHVKAPSKEKKDLFVLPLMKLPDVRTVPSSGGLLDLPGEKLPGWHALPVLNLTGSLTSLNDLMNQGALRRTALTGCLGDVSMPFDAWDLLCIEDKSW